MSNTIPNIGDINSQHNKQLNTFHTPSFGEDFEASMIQSQMMSQQQAHHMDQYHQMQMPPQQLQDPQYNMWQQPDAANQMYNMNNTMIDPQMSYGVYDAQQQMQPPTMSQPNLHYQQSPQQQSQMLMMPPPYKSPPMNAQQAQTHNQIMNSPNMNQSPHYPVPAENGTTSEDSDGSVNTLKRPSPEPLNDSPSKAGKNSSTTATVAKKPKQPRKKKKKDPNEPQKPVSAYALFFRDTQAAIKGENPNASFGEVSTIVASMWDALAQEHKEVYKKKTEAAKKEYLKTLAVYRASIVSKGDDIEPNNKPSTPTGTNSPQSNTQSSPQTSLPVQQSPSQQQQQPQQQLPVKREPIKSEPIQDSMVQLSNPQNSLNNQSQQYGGGNHIPGMPTQNQNNIPQSISQASPYQSPYNNTNAYKSPPNANHIDYNNMNMPMSNQMHPNNAPNHQMNMAHQQQQQQAPMHGNYGYEQQVPPPQNANHHPYGNSMVPPYNASPMDNVNMQQNSYGQQIPNNGHPAGPVYGNEGYTTNSIQVNQVYNNPNLNQQPKATTTMPAQLCIRDGCPNRAIMHPDWEDEYCSNECVVLMCRNVFNDWVQVQTNNTNMHQQQNNFSIVK